MTKFLILPFLLVTGVCSAQTQVREKCATESTRTTQVRPIYGNTPTDFKDYLTQQLSSLSQNTERGIFAVSMNCSGEIYETELVHGNMSAASSALVNQALSEMPAWKPAEFNGPVNYQFYVDIVIKDEQITIIPQMR